MLLCILDNLEFYVGFVQIIFHMSKGESILVVKNHLFMSVRTSIINVFLVFSGVFR